MVEGSHARLVSEQLKGPGSGLFLLLRIDLGLAVVTVCTCGMGLSSRMFSKASCELLVPVSTFSPLELWPGEFLTIWICADGLSYLRKHVYSHV